MLTKDFEHQTVKERLKRLSNQYANHSLDLFEVAVYNLEKE